MINRDLQCFLKEKKKGGKAKQNAKQNSKKAHNKTKQKEQINKNHKRQNKT